MPFPYAARRRRLLRAIHKERLDALLISHPANVRYLTGFTGDSTQLLIGSGQALMISDSRFDTQLHQECPDLERAIRTAKTPKHDFLATVIPSRKLKVVGFEATVTSYAEAQQLIEKVTTVTWRPMDGLVETLRQVKDREEVAAIRRAIDFAERGLQGTLAVATPEMTEREFAHELEHIMRRRGALGVSFEPIIGVGANAALPHYRAGHVKLSEAPFVLIDWGAVEPDGYHSDLTRVLSTSKLPPKLENLYRVVMKARDAALQVIGPGVAASEVDAASRKVISDNGFERYFGHGLGHGIGLEIHEGPRLSPTSKEVLQAGMVVTIEPGIYVPGFGGVRLEDDVLITQDGHEVLSSCPLGLGDGL